MFIINSGLGHHRFVFGFLTQRPYRQYKLDVVHTNHQFIIILTSNPCGTLGVCRSRFSAGGFGDGKGNSDRVCGKEQGAKGGEEEWEEGRVLALPGSAIVLHIL